MRLPRRCAELCCGLLLLAAAAGAEERWVVAVAELPGQAQADGGGPLLELLAALDRQLVGVTLDVRMAPFARTLLMVQKGQADLQLPYVGHLSRAPVGARYGAEPLGQVRFALYTRRRQTLVARDLLSERWHLQAAALAASGLDADQQARLGPLLGRSWRLEQLEALLGPQAALRALAFPYQVETDRAHIEVLGFPALPSNSVASSLEKLVRGRIQGYVLAPVNVEPEIDRLKLRQQLRAVHFADYPAKWLLTDTPRGAAIEGRLNVTLRALKASGEFARITAPLQRQMYWRAWP